MMKISFLFEMNLLIFSFFVLSTVKNVHDMFIILFHSLFILFQGMTMISGRSTREGALGTRTILFKEKNFFSFFFFFQKNLPISYNLSPFPPNISPPSVIQPHALSPV